ncbi:hypothetical protein ABT160_29255 [Streptomyces sp. NPDC001941]|uniref:hypothetical protein n=1 Tax=Streptomyces sp. NPDC001941 TaxID=3154659 RepID=UPI00331E096F
MPMEHPVRIDGPPTAAPELAAIRLIALLPQGWKADLIGCSGPTAAIILTVPDGMEPSGVNATVDEILSHSALRGWTRAPRTT